MFNEPRFQNLPGSRKRIYRAKRMLRLLYRVLFQRFKSKPEVPIEHVIPQTKAHALYQTLLQQDTLTWLGHSSFIIKLSGKTILTDPYLTDFASPILGLGPKRFVPPGMRITDLPVIDVIVVSHDHYDHLDLRTLAKLPNKTHTDIVVPLQLGQFFKRLGFTKIHELDWNQEWRNNDLVIRALPAYHFSKRNLFTRNQTLWASFAFQSNTKNIFFSGDTGYGPVFRDLGNNLPPFDYALLAIGAYEPAEFMLSGHLHPTQAVTIGTELHAKILVAMHWGTIILSEEPPFEPPKLFLEAGQKAGFPTENLWRMRIGETRAL